MTALFLITLGAPTLELLWSAEEGFFEPESVALNAEDGWLYVSNVNGYALNGKGYLSRLRVDGTEAEPRWVTGVNAPTGMVYRDRRLYFADYDTLRVLDTATGEQVAAHPAPNPKAGLNDVALSGNGAVYVSASGIGAVYRLTDFGLVEVVGDRPELDRVNGLWVAGDTLFTAGKTLHRWNRHTGAYLGSIASEVSAFRNMDGVTADPDGGLLVSLLDEGRLWRVSLEGAAAPVSSQQIHAVDFVVDGEARRLYAPIIRTRDRFFAVQGYAVGESP